MVMALMSFIAKNVKRSAGKSIIGAVAYRAGIIMVNAQGEVFDFSRRKMSIVHTEIFLPASAPDWAHDRNKLWNRADAAERRAKAVTGREFILNLPHELDDNQRLDLVARFAREIVQRHGCAVDAAVHRPSKKGDQRNHHVHMMLSTRRLDAIGFGEKTRELDTKKDPALEKCRETWAQFVNDALAAAGHDARIDHRSYKKQGIDKLPQWHLGSKNADLERQGIRTLAGDHNRVIAKINAMKSAPALSWTFAGWTRQEELAQQAADIREIAAQRAQRAADKAQQQEIQRAADAEEAAENAILAKREREVMESQSKAAEIAVIAYLRQKYDGLEDRYITAWESLDSKLDALHTAKNKIDHDEAEDRAGRSKSTYVLYYTKDSS
jgi:ATP-dependent exoDNAse (exonuclease V) alpha subunit